MIDAKSIPDMYYTEERQDVEILPTSTAIDIGSSIMGELYVVGNPITLVEGKTYTVTYNGVAYESVASAITIPSIGAAIGLGDVGLLATGSPTGAYPFVLAVNDAIAGEGASCAIIPLNGSTSITVSIVGYAEVVHRMPAKYLPEAPVIDISPYFTAVVMNGSTIIEDESVVNELANNAKKCDKIVLKVKNDNGEGIYFANKYGQSKELVGFGTLMNGGQSMGYVSLDYNEINNNATLKLFQF
jgi:hypothetical protein